MGEVYRARDMTLGREVAIKILPPIFVVDPDRLLRFDREARVLASLSHPNICAIHGIADINGTPGLVLELVDGRTLAELIAAAATRRRRTSSSSAKGDAQPGLGVSEALTIARDVARALEAAHEKGFIHRDLKPANIKITADGIVKVLDFGLAKASAESAPERDLDAATSGATTVNSHGLLGTAAYMSPEQARGEPLDKRTDIWSFGCVLYEMLTGRPRRKRNDGVRHDCGGSRRRAGLDGVAGDDAADHPASAAAVSRERRQTAIEGHRRCPFRHRRCV